MKALCSLEELKSVNGAIKEFKKLYPEAYSHLKDLLKINRKAGYRNICKLVLEEVTPEELKETQA